MRKCTDGEAKFKRAGAVMEAAIIFLSAPRLRRFKRNITTQVCTRKQTSHNLSQRGAFVVAIKNWFLRTRKFFETAPGTVDR
ncbi:MAG: hypothetical protein ACYC54_07545 [Sedimentisphaerales bacterium]